MRVTFNGKSEQTDSTNLADYLHVHGMGEQLGIAVAINDAVVPRSTWSSRDLQEGDRIEVLAASQGG